jgi:hypothetical protein
MNDITSLLNSESANPPPSGVDLSKVMSQGRRRRRRRAVFLSAGASLTAVAVVGGVLVASSLVNPGSSLPAAPGSASGPGTVPAPAADPVALLGVWAVTGVGPSSEAKLRLNSREIRVVQDCGELMGEWRANAVGQFVADIHASTDSCGIAAPSWLADAVGFRVEGGDVALLNAAGAVLARLTQRPSSEVPEVVVEGPDAVAMFRRWANPEPLPGRFTPATPETLVGRWLTMSGRGDRPAEPTLRFHPDGRWEGSDGCNGLGGRWIAGPDGLVMATGGPSTLIGCDNDNTPALIQEARRAGFDGEQLVLFGPDGTELARFRPGPR